MELSLKFRTTDRWLVRSWISLSVLMLASFGAAQAPDVRIKFDVLYSYRTTTNGPTIARFYDALGHYSLLSMTFYLEPGFRSFVSEKLQRIDNDADNQTLDEYYVEDEGLWRVGKQYLPFGKNLVRESALAVRGDSSLVVEGLPISLAAVDAGSGKQRGVVGRFGSNIGVSFAMGDHFAINSTALALVRRLERPSGQGFGWRQMFGIDYTNKHSQWTVMAEIVNLRNGYLLHDTDAVVTDVSATFQPKKGTSMTWGWSRNFANIGDFFRFAGAFAVSKNISFEPILRLRNGSLFDLSLGARYRF